MYPSYYSILFFHFSKSSTGVDWFIVDTEPGCAVKVHRAVDYWAKHIVEQVKNIPGGTMGGNAVSLQSIPSGTMGGNAVGLQSIPSDTMGGNAVSLQSIPGGTMGGNAVSLQSIPGGPWEGIL